MAVVAVSLGCSLGYLVSLSVLGLEVTGAAFVLALAAAVVVVVDVLAVQVLHLKKTFGKEEQVRFRLDIHTS